MKRPFFLLALAAALAGCTEDGQTLCESDYIGLEVTATRAADTYINDVRVSGFDVWAATADDAAASPSLWTIDRELHSYDETSGLWRFNSIDDWAKWPKTPDKYPMVFYALYPPYIDIEGGVMNIAGTPGSGLPGSEFGYQWWMDYAVPPSDHSSTTASRQNDMLAGTVTASARPSMPGNLGITLQHIFTSVGFKVFGDGDHVSSIRITGVIDRAILGSDGNDISWTHQYLNAVGEPLPSIVSGDEFAATIAYDPGQTYYTAGVSGNVLTEDGRLMMIPQTLGSDAKIIITYTELGTQRDLEFSLAGQVWEMGQRITYNIDLPTVSIRADYPFVLPPWTTVGSVIKSFDVKCTRPDGTPDPSMSWSFSLNPTWMRLSFDPYTSFDNLSQYQYVFSGTGPRRIYVYAQDNYGPERTAAVTLLGAGTLVLEVIQRQYGDPDLETPVDGGEW